MRHIYSPPVRLRLILQSLPTFLVFLMGWAPGSAAAQCTLVCNSLVEVPLGPNCEALITYDMILEGEDNPLLCSPNAPTDFQVRLMATPNGPTLPSSPFVNQDHVGLTLYARITHIPTGNFCVGSLRVRDYLPPIISCPPSLTVECNETTAPSLTGEATATDCTSLTITHLDQVVNLVCGNPQLSITRTWTATDISGNAASCNQLVEVIQPTLAAVVFPLNLDDIESPSLNCAGADLDPEVTGRPTFNGQPIYSGGACDLFAQYTDEVIPQCGGQYNVVRTWLVTSSCQPAFREEFQIIRVKDTTGPALVCPAPIVSGTDPFDCTGTVFLPPASVMDDCSGLTSVTIQTPFGTISNNGGFLSGVATGVTSATYQATDGCGNTSSCTVSVSVSDDTPPTAVCDDLINVTLNSLGNAFVFAATFDEGSGDNCCLAGVEVKRVGDPDSAFGNFVEFTCDDIGAPAGVVLRAVDCAGNVNTCVTQAIVEDKTNPSILCPPAITVDCAFNLSNTAVTGQPVANDACGLSTVTYADQEFFNDCQVGYLLRTWTAQDIYGYTSSCVQTISVIDTTPIEVTFPLDYATNDCISFADLHPNNLPAPFDRPVVSGDDCELTASNWNDLTFIASGNACVKILRTWTVIDWCTYDQPGDPGYFQETQILEIQDNQPPAFTCPGDLSVPILGDGCTTDVLLPQPTDIEDCLDDVEVIISGDLPGGFFHAGVGAGAYEVIYTLVDGCGNAGSCSITVTVYDGKAPGLICLNGLSTSLAPDGTLSLSAADFAVGVFDNCTPEAAIALRLGPQPAAGQTTPPAGDLLDFDCDNLGTNIVAVWAGDAAGNWGFCETYVIIEDNHDVCIPMAMIAGVVHDEEYQEIGNVAVMLNEDSSYLQMTGADGQYMFQEMPMGAYYLIRPEKDINYGNGVSTVDVIRLARHLLFIDPLDSPYKRIAADVNNSGHISVQDIIALQSLILGNTAVFPHNASWRFVDEDYVFPDPQNPFYEPWPEVKVVASLDDNMLNGNFVAVKIGDLDLSAAAGELATAGERSQLAFRTQDQPFSAGATVRVPIRSGDFRDLLGFQLTFDFDPSLLAFRAIAPGALDDLRDHHLGMRYLADGALTVSWATAYERSLSPDTVLFELEFLALGQGQLRDALEISSRITRAEAYRGEDRLEPLALTLSFEPTPQIPASGPAVFAFPNPFRAETTLTFSLPTDEVATLTIWDEQGRVVFRQERALAAGQHAWRLPAHEWQGSGAFFYRLITGETVSDGKILRSN